MRRWSRFILLPTLAGLGLGLCGACENNDRDTEVRTEREVKTPEGKTKYERKTTVDRDGDVKREVKVERKTDHDHDD